MSVGCHPDKAALWLLAFNLCLFLSQVSHSHLAASATDFARILTLIMSTVEDKLNVAMSKPGETSISRRTLTTIHSARSNYCIKLSWNMGKIRNTSPRHSRSLILSNGKVSLESIYFLPSNYIGSELAKITNTLIIYKKYKWDDDQYESKILTAITSTSTQMCYGVDFLPVGWLKQIWGWQVNKPECVSAIDDAPPFELFSTKSSEQRPNWSQTAWGDTSAVETLPIIPRSKQASRRAVFSPEKRQLMFLYIMYSS